MRMKRGEYEAAPECRGGGNGRFLRNLQTCGIIRFDSHMQKSRRNPTWNRTCYKALESDWCLNMILMKLPTESVSSCNLTIELNYTKEDKIELNRQALQDMSVLEKKSLDIRGFYKHKHKKTTVNKMANVQQRLLAVGEGNIKMADTPVSLAGDVQTLFQTRWWTSAPGGRPLYYIDGRRQENNEEREINERKERNEKRERARWNERAGKIKVQW
ncbi:hypothetical protein PR048_022097 [Dryococelus australis]|uniref:Uncharacterized protein n=1 Tax=Dryococelus australis TaxID=614101 RepID=A0ABQ9H071_9NEOP|nr:hypothetical protein PR048_022097 [Dryococelus australis]